MKSKEEILDGCCSSVIAWSDNRKKCVLNAMEEYANQSKWIDVEEKLPEPKLEELGHNFTVYGIWTDPYSQAKGAPYNGTMRFFFGIKKWSEYKYIKVTHWQELPLAPTP